ncbi:uncharacterized protein hng3 [Drosophila takahashii]|uniref:uncharacterized protein hng3 n=1 Tax=Drosophila takahashii TaxID=29030 RepID=UPI003898EAC1
MDMHRLIYEVKQRPALWDSAHPDHANRSEAQRLWNSVAENVGLGVEVCRGKWKNLRCSYRRQSRSRSTLSPSGHQWTYAEAMSFLDGQGSFIKEKEERDSSNNEEEEGIYGGALKSEPERLISHFKAEPTAIADQMEADNDALMREFQSVSTPQALRRLSENISLASAAAEEQLPPKAAIYPTGISINPNLGCKLSEGSAMAAAAASSCHCAKRVDEQVNFLENLEREEQQLMQSTSQDLARCKSILHVGDSDYNYLISFLPLMKQMTPIQNVFFRAKMGELLLQTMQQPPVQHPPMQQQQQPQQTQLQKQPQQQLQQQPSQMLLNQQQMALDQSQVSTSSTNWN